MPVNLNPATPPLPLLQQQSSALFLFLPNFWRSHPSPNFGQILVHVKLLVLKVSTDQQNLRWDRSRLWFVSLCPGPFFELCCDLVGPMQLYRPLWFLYRKNLLVRLVLVWSTVISKLITKLIRCNFVEPEPMQPKRLPLPLNKSLNVDKTLIWDHFRPIILQLFSLSWQGFSHLYKLAPDGF